MNQSFNEWYKNHKGASKETMWYVQNAICAITGFDSEDCKQARDTWANMPNEIEMSDD